MAAKDVRFSDDARSRMLRGVNILANAVKVTLARRAATRCSRRASAPHRHQGRRVGREGIELKDKFENMGAQMVKEVASNTSDEAGDGTTTATVLAQAIVREGLKAVAAGANPMDVSAASTRPSPRPPRSCASSPSRARTRRRSPRSAPSPPTATSRSARRSPTRWRRSARKA